MNLLLTVRTIYRPALLGLGIAVLVAGFSIGFIRPAAAGIGSQPLPVCQSFPQVELWQNLTHSSVRTQVEREYDGDWQAYIRRLESYGKKLRQVRTKGNTALITRGGRKVRLQGDALTQFLTHVDQRLAVTRCLADHLDGNLDVASIARFSTAASGTDGDRPVMAAMGQSIERSQPKICGAIPHVDWWTFKTHEKVAGYVFRKYKGNWTPYINTWDRRLLKLQDIYDRGSSAVTKTGVTLRGPSLADYIEKMQSRIAVTRCLAKKFGSAET